MEDLSLLMFRDQMRYHADGLLEAAEEEE